MKSILVLCEGNICRSPMAQTLLSEALPSCTVRSAGLAALVGSRADDTAIRLMQELGLDIREHRAVQINGALCVAADLVLVMDARQRENLLALYPQARGKVFLLGHTGGFDVPDPYRQDESAFRFALARIQRGVADWHARVSQLVKQAP